LDALLFVAVARAVERRVGECDAQNLANTAWAVATTKLPHSALFVFLARAADRRVGDFICQGLANVALAFSKAGC